MREARTDLKTWRRREFFPVISAPKEKSLASATYHHLPKVAEQTIFSSFTMVGVSMEGKVHRRRSRFGAPTA